MSDQEQPRGLVIQGPRFELTPEQVQAYEARGVWGLMEGVRLDPQLPRTHTCGICGAEELPAECPRCYGRCDDPDMALIDGRYVVMPCEICDATGTVWECPNAWDATHTAAYDLDMRKAAMMGAPLGTIRELADALQLQAAFGRLAAAVQRPRFDELTIREAIQQLVELVNAKKLTKTQYRVIVERFGIGHEGSSRRLDEVAALFAPHLKVTRERVRIWETQAIHAIRKHFDGPAPAAGENEAGS